MAEDNEDGMLLKYVYAQLFSDVFNGLYSNLMFVTLWRKMGHDFKTDVESQIANVIIKTEILRTRFSEYDKMTITDKKSFISEMPKLQGTYWKMQNTMLKESLEFSQGEATEAYKKLEEMLKKAPQIYG